MQKFALGWAWWLAPALSALYSCLHWPNSQQAGPDTGRAAQQSDLSPQGRQLSPAACLEEKVQFTYAKAWLQTVCALLSASFAALQGSWRTSCISGYQFTDLHMSTGECPLKAVCPMCVCSQYSAQQAGSPMGGRERLHRAVRGRRYAHLLHHFAELTSIFDACLSPVLSALCRCGSLGVEQACSNQETDKVGLLEAIIAPFLVQLHTVTVHCQLA